MTFVIHLLTLKVRDFVTLVSMVKVARSSRGRGRSGDGCVDEGGEFGTFYEKNNTFSSTAGGGAQTHGPFHFNHWLASTASVLLTYSHRRTSAVSTERQYKHWTHDDTIAVRASTCQPVARLFLLLITRWMLNAKTIMKLYHHYCVFNGVSLWDDGRQACRRTWLILSYKYKKEGSLMVLYSRENVRTNHKSYEV